MTSCVDFNSKHFILIFRFSFLTVKAADFLFTLFTPVEYGLSFSAVSLCSKEGRGIILNSRAVGGTNVFQFIIKSWTTIYTAWQGFQDKVRECLGCFAHFIAAYPCPTFTLTIKSQSCAVNYVQMYNKEMVYLYKKARFVVCGCLHQFMHHQTFLVRGTVTFSGCYS